MDPQVPVKRNKIFPHSFPSSTSYKCDWRIADPITLRYITRVQDDRDPINSNICLVRLKKKK